LVDFCDAPRILMASQSGLHGQPSRRKGRRGGRGTGRRPSMQGDRRAGKTHSCACPGFSAGVRMRCQRWRLQTGQPSEGRGLPVSWSSNAACGQN